VAACGVLFALSGCRHATAPDGLVCAARNAVGDDPGMGSFSIVALTIGTALGDPVARASVHDALVAATAPRIGAGPAIDLQDCTPGALVGRLLEVGTERTGGSSVALCAALRGYPGVALWVNDDRLAVNWSGVILSSSPLSRTRTV
jgi:hypothetical protein